MRSCYFVICMYTGIPWILNLQGSASNTSVSLQWELPDNIELRDIHFNVRFTLSPLLKLLAGYARELATVNTFGTQIEH